MAKLETSLLRIYSYISSTKTLGPGKRYALWVQGCPFTCKGCLAPNSLPLDGGEMIAVSDIISDITSVAGLEGITISGGEPFLQAGSLALLAAYLRSRNYGVIVYSGYTYSALNKMAKRSEDVNNFLKQVDLLIDGLYVASKDDGKSLRGSSNQQLHFLTDRYKELSKDFYHLTKRHIEIHFTGESTMLVGIPGKEVINKITYDY